MAIAPLAFSQLATTGVTADPRAELERLRKLKRLKELEAKASGAAPQPAPAQPATAGPVNQTDATNPIVAAQRASQVQTGNAFAAQKAEEQRRIQERRDASRAYGAGMDMIVTTDDQGQLQPGTDVDRDISKGVIGSPIQFGQGLAEGTANFINNATNIGAEGLNAANKLLLGDKAFKFTGTDIQVPQNVIVDQGGPLQSTTGMAPRIAGQIMSTRVPLGKVMPGGGVGAEIAKDAVSYAAATDKDTQRVSDMLPAGTPMDFLRSREGESYAEAFAKNALEDAGLSAAATALLKGGVKVLDSVGNQPMTPTNAGGANLGSPRPMPAQRPANALASPPAPVQAASAAQPSVVPQPTVSQAGTAGTGQQAGAGVGAGGGGAVPPAGPATLQATPRNVPVAVGKEELAVQRDTLKAVSRFMRGARIPRNVVNDYTASLLGRYEPLKSERYSLAFFVEDDLPQYLQSRGYTPAEARNYAGDTTAKLQGWGRAANSFNESGNSARYLIQDVIHRLTTSQKSELEGTFKAVLGDETLMGRSDEIGALMRQNGEEAYNNSISEANRLIKDGKASPEQVRAAQELNAILTNDGFKQFYPDSLTVEAATRGKTVDQLIQERLAADPIEAAHWLQSEIGKSARNARDGLQKDMASTYEAMRKAILDRLEQFPGYRGARMQHGDLFGADDAVSFGDRFLTAARSEFKTDQMARELEKLSPRQQAVAALSIRDAMLNPLLRGSPEDAAARITELQKEGTLKALVTVLGEERGTELRNAIANMRVENQRISAISQASGSNTHLNQQGARDAIDNIRSPGNRLVHGAGNPTGWGVAGIASMAMGNPLPLVAKAVASAVDKASTPGARFQSRATKGLYGLPEAVDDAAGAVPPNANALASPPPSGGPAPFGGAGGGNTTGNALSRPPPRTRAQRPPPTMEEWAQRIETDQNELQRLLKQYDQIDRADPNVDDLMRANLAKQKNARRRIAEKTKKMEAARAAQPEPEPAVPNAPQIAPTNAFNAEPQAAAQAAPSGNAFNGKRALPGETSNSSPAVTGALVSGGLTGGATYAATGDEDLALRAGGLAAIGGAVAGNRLAKFGSSAKPPKPPVPKAPVAGGPVATKDRAVWEMRGAGLSNAEIARRADTTESMVDVHYRKAERALGAPPSDPSVLSKYPEKAPTQAAKSVSTAEPFTSKAGNATLNYEERPFWWADDSLDVSMDYVPEKPPTLSETKDLFTQMYDRMKAKMQAEGRSVYSANGDTPSKRKLYDSAVKALPPPDGYTPMKSPGSDMILFVRNDMVGKLPEGAPKDLAPISSVTPLKPAPKPPTRQGMGINASGAGAAGGGILGYALNPADANGDGVIDDLDRGLNGFGGMVSGGIAGKALGSRAAGKFGNRMKGPPRDMRGVDQNGIKAYHGSPHDFDKFELSDKTIGTGEGAQAYGHGLYFAENEAVAKGYRDVLGADKNRKVIGRDGDLPSWVASDLESGRDPQVLLNDFEARLRKMEEGIASGADNQPWVTKSHIPGIQRIIDNIKAVASGEAKLGPKGRLYEVDINSAPEDMLDWDKPLSQQSEAVRRKLADTIRLQKVPLKNNMGTETTVGQMIGYLENRFGNKADVLYELKGVGIPGIKYLDQGSRGKARGTSNYVVFDDKNVNIINKQGFLGSGKAESRPKPPPNRTDAAFDPSQSQSSKLLAGLGGPSGAGAAGGGILGATLAPDANGDGTVDAQERANGFLGGAFSGGIAGKALGSRAAGKFGNRLSNGMRRGGSRADDIDAQGIFGDPIAKPGAEPPTIKLSDLKGAKIFHTTADHTRTGGAYTGIDSSLVDNPVPLPGGPKYGLRPDNAEHGVAFANNGGVAGQKVTKITNHGATHMIINVGDTNQHISSVTANRAFFDTMRAYVRDGRISQKNARAITKLIKGSVTKDEAVHAAMKAFPGFEDVQALDDYARSISFEARKRLLTLVGSKDARELGAPNLKRILDATREPGTAGRRWGDGEYVVKLDPNGTLVKLGDQSAPEHPDFPTGIRGEVIGKLDAPINYETLAQDWLAADKASKLAANPNATLNQRRGFDMARPVIEITDDLLSRIGEIKNAGISSARHAKLTADFAADNWRASNLPVKQGGSSPADFINAIDDSPGAAVLDMPDLSTLKKDIRSGKTSIYQLGDDGQVFFSLERGDPGYEASYGVKTPGIGPNEVKLGGVINNELGAGGMGHAVMLKALTEGATVLDAFAVKSAAHPDGFLPEFYKKFGFEVVAEVPFDKKYYTPQKLADAVDFWKKSTKGYDPEINGYPPLVIMKWTGTDAQRANLVAEYHRRGLQDLFGGRNTPHAAPDEDFLGSDAARKAGKAGSGGRQARGAGGGQGYAGKPPVPEALTRATRGLSNLTDAELRNLGRTPADREAARKSLGLKPAPRQRSGPPATAVPTFRREPVIAQQGFFGSSRAAGRPKPPPNRLASGPPRPKREGPSTASRMVAGGVIGGIAGSAGSADPQSPETAAMLAQVQQERSGTLEAIAKLEADRAFFRDADITEIQKRLKREGYDLGKTGPNKDGIDGNIGGVTGQAINGLKAQIDSDLKTARERFDKLELDRQKWESQASFERTKPSPETEALREAAPWLGALAGIFLGGASRYGTTAWSKSSSAAKAARANALLTPGPVTAGRSKASRTALQEQPARVNMFWHEGGAGQNVPFEAITTGKDAGGWKAKPKAASPYSLYPEKTPHLRASDYAIIGSALLESGVSTAGVMQAEESVRKAQEAIDKDATEANRQQLQNALNMLALAQAAQRFGLLVAATHAAGGWKLKYKDTRPALEAAEAERARILEHLKKAKTQTAARQPKSVPPTPKAASPKPPPQGKVPPRQVP